MAENDNLPVQLNDNEELHDIIEQEITSENQELLQSEEEIESNLAALRQIQQGTYTEGDGAEPLQIETRNTSRKKRGFFGRVKSFFSFRKTGRNEDPAQTGRQRADNHYQDYLIAKAAFDKQAYDLYQQSSDGISITANDMASGEADGVPQGKNNIVYGDIFRLVGAQAKFVHSTLRGKDNVTYSSPLAQLKMLGEYRTLNARENVTLFKDFATDTEKLDFITSAEFDIEGGRIHVDTGTFLIKNGNGRPALYFTKGNISLASEKFRLDLTKITASPEGITAGNTHLRLKEPLEDKGTDFDISQPLFLSFTGGIGIPTGQDKSGPILMKNKEGMLTVGRVATMVLGDLEYLGITFINARMTGVTDLGDGEVSDNATFFADEAIINGADFIKMSNIKASRTENSAVINNADISISGIDNIESITATLNEFALYKNKLPDFSKLLITATGITFDDLVKISKADFLLSKDDKDGISAFADISNAQINVSTDSGFGVSADSINGNVTLNNTGGSLNISAETADISVLGLFSVTGNTLSYEQGKFTAESITAAAPNIIDKAGLLTLNGVSVTANKLIIDKTGLNSSEINGEIAEFSLLELPKSKISFTADNSGFSACALFDRDEHLIDNDYFKLLLKGNLNVSSKEGAFGASFDEASLGLSVKDKSRIDIGNFSVSNGVFSFSGMSGLFDITDVLHAKLKDGSGTVSSSASDIKVNLEKLVFGSDNVVLDNMILGVTDKSANLNVGAVTVPEVFSLKDFKGQISSSGVEQGSAKLVIEKPEFKLDVEVTGAGISGNGLVFDEIKVGLGPINIGDFLSAEGSNLSVSKSENDGYKVSAGFSKLSTNLSLGDLSVKSTTAEGSLAYSSEGAKVSFSGGSITASFRDIFGVTMSGLGYENSTLRADSVTGTEITADLLGGFVSLTKAKLSAAFLRIDKTGIKYDDDGGVTLDAESVSLFGTALKKPELKWTNEGFTGKATLEGNKTYGINSVFTIKPKGELGIAGSKTDTRLITNAFEVEFKLFNALTLGMKDVRAENGEFVSGAISGGISLPAEINVGFTGKNLRVNKSGPSVDSFSATLPQTEFLNGLVKASGEMSAEKNFETIDAKGAFDIKTAFLTASGSAETSFSKTAGAYKQSFRRLDAAGNAKGSFISVEGIKLSNGGEDSLSLSAKKISIPSVHAGVDEINGEISSKSVHLNSANIHFEKISDFNPVDTEVKNLFVEADGVSFEQIKVKQEHGFSLGGILSAKSGELLFAKAKNKPLSITGTVSDMHLDMPAIGSFGLSAKGISGLVTYADNALSAQLKSGELGVGFSDLFSLQLSGLSFKDGVFGASSVVGSLSGLSLMGDAISVSGVTVNASDIKLSKAGITSENGLNGTIDSIKVFSAELNNSDFSVSGNKFTASALLNTDLKIGSFFSISAKGGVTLTKTAQQAKKEDGDNASGGSSMQVDLSNFGGEVKVFSAGFSISNVSSKEDGMLIGEMKGDVTLGSHFTAGLSGKNILVGKDSLVTESPILGTASEFDILGGAVHFNKSTLTITENLTKYDFANSFKLSAGSVSGDGGFSAHLEKGKPVPEIKFTNVNASIAGGTLEGMSLSYAETGVSFAANLIKIGEHISLSTLKGNVAKDALDVQSANVAVVNAGKELVKTEIKNAHIGKDGFTFDEITTSANDIDLGGFLTAKSSALKLSDTADKGFSAEFMISSLAANHELGGFFIKASNVSGSVTYSENSVTAKTDSGALEAGYLDIVKFGLSDISFGDNVLTGSVVTEAEGQTAGYFGDLLSFSNMKLSAEKLSLGASGVSLSEGGRVDFSADYISILGKTVTKPNIALTKEGFEGSATLENQSISPFSGTVFTFSGKIGISKKGEGQITPITDNFNISVDLLKKAVVLNANQISVGNGAFKTDSINGTISALGKKLADLNAKNVSIGNEISYSSLDAAFSPVSLFNDTITLGNDQKTITSTNIEQIFANVKAGVKAGSVDFSAVTHLEFNKANGYAPKLLGIDEILLKLGSLSMQGFSIKESAQGGAFDFTGKELSLGIAAFKATDISGTLSKNEFTLTNASAQLNNVFGGTLTQEIKNLSITKDGLFFENISFGKKGINLGGILSAQAASISISNPKGEAFKASAQADEVDIAAAFGAFALSGDKLSLSGAYSKGSVDFSVGGSLCLDFANLLKVNADGLSYSNGVISAQTLGFAKDSLSILDGLVRIDGLSIAAQDFSLSKDGLGSKAVTVSSSGGLFILSKKALSAFSFDLLNEGFAVDTVLSKENTAIDFSPLPVKAALSGHLKMKISKSEQTASFDEIGAEVTVFDQYKVGAENIHITANNELAADVLTGVVKLDHLGGAEFKAEAKNVVMSASGFDFTSFTGGLEGKHEFFGGLMSISNPSLSIIKEGGTMNDIELGGSIGFESEYAEGSVGGTLVFSKDKAFVPRIKELNNATLKIPSLGAGITVASITQTENELCLNNVSIGKTKGKGDSPFNALLDKIPNVSATLPKITYSFASKKFDYNLSDITFADKDYEVDIIKDKLKGIFNPGTYKLGVKYTLAAPEDMKTSDGVPHLLGLDLDVPLVPGVSVGGALFAGAGILMDTTAEINFAKDDNRTSFDLGLDLDIKKALAGIGVEAYIKFGVPGINATLGLRGQLLGRADPSACKFSAKMGLNYDKGKGFSFDDQKTSLSLSLKADLVAQLQAFFRAKLLAFVDKELFSFNIAEKKIAGIEFSAHAASKDGKWEYDADSKFIKPESGTEIFFNQKLVDWEKKANVSLEQAKKLFDNADNFFLTMHGLGYNETVLQSAILMRDIIPELKKLRNLHLSSIKTLKQADKKYLSEFKVREAKIAENHAIMQNYLQAKKVEQNPEVLEKFKQMTIDAGVTDNTISSVSKDQMDFNAPQDKLFFMSPVQVLAYLSHLYLFDASKKADTLAKKMKSYNEKVGEIEWLFKHPVGSQSEDIFSESYINELIEKQSTSAYLEEMMENQDTSKTDDIVTKAKQADKDLKGVKGEIDKLISINNDIDSAQKEIDAVSLNIKTLKGKQNELQSNSDSAKKKAISKESAKVDKELKTNEDKLIGLKKKQETLFSNRDEQQKQLENTKKGTNVKNLTLVFIRLGDNDKKFGDNRMYLRAARNDPFRNRYTIDEKREVFDPFTILNCQDKPGRFFLSRAEKDESKAVDFKTFKQYVISVMRDIAFDTRKLVTSYMKGSTLRSGSKELVQKSGMSNQIKKAIFTNEIYGRAGAAERVTEQFRGQDSLLSKDFVWGKGEAPSKDIAKVKQDYYAKYAKKSSEQDNISNSALLQTMSYDRAQNTNALEALGEKLNGLEDIIRTTNETYAKANETLVRLVAMDMSSFSSTITNDVGKNNDLMGESLNTLVTSESSIKTDLSTARINKLTEQTTTLETDLKKKVGE